MFEKLSGDGMFEKQCSPYSNLFISPQLSRHMRRNIPRISQTLQLTWIDAIVFQICTCTQHITITIKHKHGVSLGFEWMYSTLQYYYGEVVFSWNWVTIQMNKWMKRSWHERRFLLFLISFSVFSIAWMITFLSPMNDILTMDVEKVEILRAWSLARASGWKGIQLIFSQK